MSRIILVGSAGSGKDFLKKKFKERGFDCDISYTTRPIREGEVDGIDYHFISEPEFVNKFYDIYEYAKHGDYLYGTGWWEWNNCDIFIMETHGILEITQEDRKNCFIIYLNPSLDIREKRLKERGWNEETIAHRFKTDNDKFRNFKDYDMNITNPNF